MVIVAQMVRVTHCECEGREFKSHLSPNMVFVVERLRRKIVVLVYAGSNPVKHPTVSLV